MQEDIERSEFGDPILRHRGRERAFQVAHGDSESMEKIEKHIESHIGVVDNVYHELISDLVHIDVHIVNPTPERNWVTLVTTGMSDLPMAVPEGMEDYRYAELVIALPPDWPLDDASHEDERNYWPIRWLKSLARFPHEYESAFGWGHSIPNGDPPQPFASNTEACCMILLDPALASESFSQFKINEEKTIHFYSLVPLYAEEMKFKLKKGAEELVDRLEEVEITELLDLNRKNVCKKRFGLF